MASCPRKSVGCVIVIPGGTVVAGGWNGAPDHMESCHQSGCIDEGGHCVRSVHAEIRAIAYAAKRGVMLSGAEAYTTLLPCINCMQALLEAGVRTIHYDQEYTREERNTLFKLAEIGRVILKERIR